MKGGIEGRLFELDDVPNVARELAKRPPRPKDALVEAREFGGWTLDKLEVLDRYLSQYRRVAGNGTYLDAFSGEGRYQVRGDPTVRPGSPLVAAASGAFKYLHFFEVDPVKVTSLKAALDAATNISAPCRSRCTVHEGDSNKTLPAVLASGIIDDTKPCFAFLDPDSTQLDWATVEAISSFKTHIPGTKACKVELWILFNLHQAVQRLWPRDRSQLPPAAGVLDRIMGDRSVWIDLWSSGQSSSHLLHRYRERLEQALGYRYVLPQVIRDPKSRRPQYHMIHASDHVAAVSFMRYAKRASLSVAGAEPLFHL